MSCFPVATRCERLMLQGKEKSPWSKCPFARSFLLVWRDLGIPQFSRCQGELTALCSSLLLWRWYINFHPVFSEVDMGTAYFQQKPVIQMRFLNFHTNSKYLPSGKLYVTYVMLNNQWYRCDDSSVTRVVEHTVRTSQAYVLLYQRASLVVWFLVGLAKGSVHCNGRKKITISNVHDHILLHHQDTLSISISCINSFFNSWTYLKS